MSEASNGKKEGVSLLEINFCFMFLAIMISGILFWSMYRTNKLNQEMNNTTVQMTSLKESSYMMQLASDYLTEQMRCFAVTGEMKYLDNYFEEAKVTKRREKALESLEEVYGNNDSVRNLTISMAESIDLMNLEYYAARLAYSAYGYDISTAPEEIQAVELSDEDRALSKEKQKSRAAELLFSEEYRQRKEAISEHLLSCLNQITMEIQLSHDKATQKQNKQVFGEHLLTVILILIMIGIVFLTYGLIIHPLQKCVELIRDEKSIPPTGAYEIKFLAKTYNLMYNMNLANIDKLTYEATHDQLTGCYNNRGFDFLVQNLDIKTCTFIRLEIDDFAKLEEEHGKEGFEYFLKKTADVIQKNVRAHDYVFRWDGDRFGIIMMHVESGRETLIQNKIKIINERIRRIEDGMPGFSLSAGVAFGQEGQSPEEVLEEAEKALKKAMKRGKAEVYFYKEVF